MQAFGKRSVDLLDEAGWLTSRTWVAHGIHFNADEIERLGRAGVGVCHCAASDMAVRHGDLPDRRTRGRGRSDRPRRRRLGLERFVEHDGGGAPFADARAAALRPVGGHAATTRCAGRREGSARCLGRDDIGAIAAGHAGGPRALHASTSRASRGAQDPIAALVLCGAHRADRVMVAGRWRVIDGEPEGVDLEALIARHKAAARAFA